MPTRCATCSDWPRCDSVDRFVAALAGGDALDGIRLLDELERDGRDLVAFADQVVARLREQLIESLAEGARTGDRWPATGSRRASARRPRRQPRRRRRLPAAAGAGPARRRRGPAGRPPPSRAARAPQPRRRAPAAAAPAATAVAAPPPRRSRPPRCRADARRPKSSRSGRAGAAEPSNRSPAASSPRRAAESAPPTASAGRIGRVAAGCCSRRGRASSSGSAATRPTSRSSLPAARSRSAARRSFSASRRARRSCATSRSASDRCSRRGSATCSAAPSRCAAWPRTSSWSSRSARLPRPSNGGRSRRTGAPDLRRRSGRRRRGRLEEVGVGYGNMAKMAQQMQAEMARVQAELEALTLEGTAGGGAVTAVVNGHGEVMSMTHRQGRRRSGRRRDAPGPDHRGRQRRRPPGQAGDRGEDGPRDRRPAHPGHRADVATLIEPVARLIEALSRLPGVGPKTAQRLTYHLLRAPEGGGTCPGRGAHRRARRGRLLRVVLQHQHRPAVPDLRRSVARRHAPVRGRGAARRARDRAHRLVQGPLPRPPRRDLADGRHRPRSAQGPRAARSRGSSAAATASRTRRWCWRRTRRSRARRRRCTSPSV